jgi:Ni,Fe-hydrogenase maturation factor
MNVEAMYPRVLVLGYGNPGRQDDALGPAAALAIAQMGFQNVKVESPTTC